MRQNEKMSLLKEKRPSKRLSFKVQSNTDSEGSHGASEEETGSEDWDDGGASSGRAAEDSDEEDITISTPIRRQTMREQTFLDRLKAKRSTKSNFGLHVNLAFKCALFVVLGNLPMLIHPLQELIPPQFWPFLGSVGLYVAFTFWKSLGATIAYAFQGISGCLLATMPVTMTTTLIGGTTPTTNLQGCFVWLNFVVFIALVLWLNLEPNTRCVALCVHVGYFMTLLKPEDPDVEKKLMKTFSFEEMAKFPQEVVSCFVVTAGALLALLAAALPLIPVLPATYVFKVGDALRYAEEEAQDIAMTMGQLVLDAVKAFSAHSQSLMVEGFIAQAEHMHIRLQKLDDMCGDAWWEVIWPFTSARKLRLRVIKDMHDILISVLDNLIILLYTLKYEDFMKSHEAMMDEIEVPLEDLATFFTDELNKAMDTLLQGQMTGKPANRKDVLRQKKELISELGEVYMKTLDDIVGMKELEANSERQSVASHRSTTQSSQRGSLFMFNDDMEGRQTQVEILYETMEESHFVYRLILLTDRLISRLDRVLDPEDTGPRCSLIVLLVNHLTNPDILFNSDHITFAVRQSFTIVTCFIVCSQYYNYSPTMAATQSLLVYETYTGSMLKRNMGRFQGVVIGTIFPHLFFDWFSECNWTHEITLVVILFLFEWISMYVYYASEEYSYVGCLVGAFGANALCQGCGRNPNTMKTLYLIMEQNAVGIAVLTVVDLIFAPERASDLANHQMSQVEAHGGKKGQMGNLPLLQYGLATALNLDPTPVEEEDAFQQYGRVVQPERFSDWNRKAIRQIRNATNLCDEAEAEPRYMRRPWPRKFYEDANMVCQGLRTDIIALTDAVGSQFMRIDDREILFNKNQEFKRFVHKLIKSFSTVANMVRLALKHFDEEAGEEGKRKADIHEEAALLRLPTEEDITKLSKALVNQPEFWKVRRDIEKRRLSVRSHVLTDTFCRTSVAVCVLKNITRRLHRLHTLVVDCV